MNAIANFIDFVLYAMFAITIALIVYKTIDVLAPKWLKKGTIQERYIVPDKGIQDAEDWMTLLVVLASIGPFVGLTGTVMHIIEALKGMSGAGVDMAVISGPIATALNATLVGLASAIPAAIAHALLSRQIQKQYNQAIQDQADNQE